MRNNRNLFIFKPVFFFLGGGGGGGWGEKINYYHTRLFGRENLKKVFILTPVLRGEKIYIYIYVVFFFWGGGGGEERKQNVDFAH